MNKQTILNNLKSRYRNNNINSLHNLNISQLRLYEANRNMLGASHIDALVSAKGVAEFIRSHNKNFKTITNLNIGKARTYFNDNAVDIALYVWARMVLEVPHDAAISGVNRIPKKNRRLVLKSVSHQRS